MTGRAAKQGRLTIAMLSKTIIKHFRLFVFSIFEIFPKNEKSFFFCVHFLIIKSGENGQLIKSMRRKGKKFFNTSRRRQTARNANMLLSYSSNFFCATCLQKNFIFIHRFCLIFGTICFRKEGLTLFFNSQV